MTKGRAGRAQQEAPDRLLRRNLAGQRFRLGFLQRHPHRPRRAALRHARGGAGGADRLLPRRGRHLGRHHRPAVRRRPRARPVAQRAGCLCLPRAQLLRWGRNLPLRLLPRRLYRAQRRRADRLGRAAAQAGHGRLRPAVGRLPAAAGTRPGRPGLQFPDRHKAVPVRCIGVWDTVGSLGVPGNIYRALPSSTNSTTPASAPMSSTPTTPWRSTNGAATSARRSGSSRPARRPGRC